MKKDLYDEIKIEFENINENSNKKISKKNFRWIGTILSLIMYISYVPQIMRNLHGNKTFFLQPLATVITAL